MSALLITAAVLPGLAVTFGMAAGEQRRDPVARVGVALNLAALGLAFMVFISVWADSPVSAVIENGSGEAVLGLVADRVTSVLLLLVLGVSAVVQAFAGRYLSGDVRAVRFFNGANLLTFSTALMVASVTFIGLAVAWTLAGISVILLLAMYSGFGAAREGVRRAIRIFLIGDLALWTAVVLATIEWGSLDLRTLGQQGPELAGRLAADPGRLPAGRRRDGALGPAAPPELAAGHASRADAGLGPAPRWCGQRRWHPPGPAEPGLRRLVRGDPPGLFRRRRHDRLRDRPDALQGRHQGGPRALDHGSDGLHDHDLRARRLRRGDLPPLRPRHVQGDAVPRIRLGGPQPRPPHQGATRPDRWPDPRGRSRSRSRWCFPRWSCSPSPSCSTRNARRAPTPCCCSPGPPGPGSSTAGAGRHSSLAGALSGAGLVTLAAGAYVLLLSSVTEFMAPALAGAGDCRGLALVGRRILRDPAARRPDRRWPVRAAGSREVRKTLYVIALGAGQVTEPRPRPVRSGQPVKAGAGGLMPDSQGARP